MMSKNPQQTTSKKSSSSHRLDILRTFLYQAVMSFLTTQDFEIENGIDDQVTQKDKENNAEMNVGIETYWCSEYHKCHAMKLNDNILCVLYNSSVPNPAMRMITEKTLKCFISDKQICW